MDKIIELEGETILAYFKDNCALEIEIISTSHMIDGGDVVGKVNHIECDEKKHKHPSTGDF